MKRIFRFLFFLIVLLLASAMVLPIVFKDSILERIKQEANANLNAKFDFKDVDLSLITTFPYFGFSLEGLEISGIEEFEGEKLLSAGEFSLSIDLMSVLSGESYRIEKIAVNDLDLNVLILENGKANFDIMKETEASADTVQSGESTPFHLALSSYELNNINLNYRDLEGDMTFALQGLNHAGSGDFTENVVGLKTHTEVEAMSFSMEGMDYLSRVHLESDFDMDLIQDKFRFNFGKNYVSLNGLQLNFEGWLAMPDESIDMDLKFNSPDNSFKSLISLIPALYYKDFESLKTSGEFKLNGLVQGKYINEIYPSFNINLMIREGFFQYPDLPSAVSDVNIDFQLVNKSRNLDNMALHIPRMEAKVAGSQISGSLDLKDPMRDPDFKFLAQAKANLEDLSKALPMEGYEMAGVIDMDMNASGRLSMIDNEQYDALKAGGYAKASNLQFGGDSLGMEISLPKAELSLSPQMAKLGPTTLIYEGNTMEMQGQLDNLLSYALRDELLRGELEFYSPRLDLLALAGEESTEASTDAVESDTAALAVIRLPENIDFHLNAKVDSLLYDQIRISQLVGGVRLKEGRASLENVKMQMLGGAMRMNGGYDSKPELPLAEFDFAIEGFSFRESYEALDMVKQIAPIMKNMEGRYTMDLSMSTLLGSDMSPQMNSVNASGSLATKSVQTGGKVFDQLATFLKNPDYRQLKVSDIDLEFTLEDGQLKVEPFDFKMAGQKAELGGSMSLAQELDFDLNTSIPLSGLKADAYLKQFQSLSSGTIPLTVKIGGTATSPEVRPSLGDLKKQLGEELKQKLNQAVDSVKTQVKEEVNKKLDELVKAAEEQGDKLIAEAKARGDQLKAEAKKQADKLRASGEQAAQKIMDEAGNNPLKQAAAKPLAEKARKEANEKAQKLEDEAAQQANDLIKAAEEQKQKLIEDARAKAQI
ncbi:AsmA-like C-terminal region-containing protein [Croceimicrobium sp.]|uniref:AsmA-like C-terminal region-containing protein n=1 Tax=Croceimicrobium sp. TaxID=2828340 RepID=UPI003BABDCAE